MKRFFKKLSAVIAAAVSLSCVPFNTFGTGVSAYGDDDDYYLDKNNILYTEAVESTPTYPNGADIVVYKNGVSRLCHSNNYVLMLDVEDNAVITENNLNLPENYELQYGRFSLHYWEVSLGDVWFIEAENEDDLVQLAKMSQQWIDNGIIEEAYAYRIFPYACYGEELKVTLESADEDFINQNSDINAKFEKLTDTTYSVYSDNIIKLRKIAEFLEAEENVKEVSKLGCWCDVAHSLINRQTASEFVRNNDDEAPVTTLPPVTTVLPNTSVSVVTSISYVTSSVPTTTTTSVASTTTQLETNISSISIVTSYTDTEPPATTETMQLMTTETMPTMPPMTTSYLIDGVLRRDNNWLNVDNIVINAGGTAEMEFSIPRELGKYESCVGSIWLPEGLSCEYMTVDGEDKVYTVSKNDYYNENEYEFSMPCSKVTLIIKADENMPEGKYFTKGEGYYGYRIPEKSNPYLISVGGFIYQNKHISITVNDNNDNSSATAPSNKINHYFLKKYGDANNDEHVNIADVVKLNMYLLNPDENSLDDVQLANADCIKDDVIDAKDSSAIMSYIAMVIPFDALRE